LKNSKIDLEMKFLKFPNF